MPWYLIMLCGWFEWIINYIRWQIYSVKLKWIKWILSWADILGNAYISLFFSSGQNPQMSQQALSAYSQAVSRHPLDRLFRDYCILYISTDYLANCMYCLLVSGENWQSIYLKCWSALQSCHGNSLVPFVFVLFETDDSFIPINSNLQSIASCCITGQSCSDTI